jgi:hypothetical protein
MSKQVPKETFNSPEHQSWLKDRREQDQLNPRPITLLAGRPLTIGVEGDELVIRIGVDTLVYAFETGEDNQPFDEDANDFRRSWKVIDKHDFAKGVGIALCDEEEDGSTPLTKILDVAYIRAVEDDMGVDEDGRIVTSEMLQYSGSEDIQ